MTWGGAALLVFVRFLAVKIGATRPTYIKENNKHYIGSREVMQLNCVVSWFFYDVALGSIKYHVHNDTFNVKTES